MNQPKSLLIALMLLAAGGSEAPAQQGRGRGAGAGRGGSTELLADESVQQELMLTSEQKERLGALRREQQAGRQGRGNGGNLTDEERAVRRQRAEEREKQIAVILTADQAKRLKEISLQVRGYAALDREEVAKAVGLSDEQKNSVKSIGDETAAKTRELMGNTGADREARRKELAELRQVADSRYALILTEEQKTKFAALKGPKFNVEGLTPRRRGGN